LKDTIDKLKKLLGRSKAVDDPAIVNLYSREPSGYRGSSLTVVFPESLEDLSRLASFAYNHGIPLYPQGSTTNLSGSAVPEGGLIVSFERMWRIKEVNVLDSITVVEPGVRLGDLNSVLAGYGYMFPVDPASVNTATVGGAVNNGSGGMRGAKYGSMRDWVLGLKVILADEKGSPLELGCRTLVCHRGFDLVGLIVGSEGTLALISEAILRITPLPESSVTALAFLPDLDSLIRVYEDLKSSGVQATILEFMDPKTVELASKTAGFKEEVEGYMILATVDCNVEGVARIEDWLRKLMLNHGAMKVYTARSIEEAEVKGLFSIRRSLVPSQVRLGASRYPSREVTVYIEDISVPPSKLAEALRGIEVISSEKNLDVYVGGHIGDGNIHPTVVIPLDDERLVKVAEEWHFEIAKLALELGGTMSSEHGIGLRKKELLVEELRYIGGLKALELMKEIKKVFDPKGILNPGKIFI
jgi:glycolate oxidase